MRWRLCEEKRTCQPNTKIMNKVNSPGELTIANTSVVKSITGNLPSANAISFSLSPLTNVGQQREISAETTEIRDRAQINSDSEQAS